MTKGIYHLSAVSENRGDNADRNAELLEIELQGEGFVPKPLPVIKTTQTAIQWPCSMAMELGPHPLPDLLNAMRAATFFTHSN